MFKKFLSTVAVAVMATSAADYMFPTAYPSGVDMDTVKQIVSFIWDDNAYSGLNKTDYETEPGQQFKDHHWVGGMKPWENAPKASTPNGLNIQEGDMGMSWAITTLAGAKGLLPPSYDPKKDYNNKSGKIIHNDSIWSPTGWVGTGKAPSLDPSYPEKNGGHWEHLWKFEGSIEDFMSDNFAKKNPDGSPIQFSFNVISGLFVPIFDNPAGGKGDGYRVSKFGYWQPNAKDLIEFPHLDAYKSPTQSIPISWGREMPVKEKEGDEGNVNGETYGRINDIFKMTRDFGHEIGNHTIDHLESNSMLPEDERGFGRWGGEGFAADEITEVSYADTTYTVSEVEEFGTTPGISWHSAGWELYAGKMLSENAWKGIIELGEEDLEIELGMKPRRKGGKIGAFRAPRLEVTSGLFYALKDLGYEYDCGLEDGYQYHVNGTNFYWPYTMDNGAPNLTHQRMIGAKVSVESTPAGLWQYPVNAMIVPEDIREEVYANYAIVARADGFAPTPEDSTFWVEQSGRVTGFDFNMFILWGMTKETALKTLKHNLDLRMQGGKAPMQVGAHTDYFTPIYDNATLRSPANIKTFGLCIEHNWNNWEDRKATFEEFIDYGMDKGAYFWSGTKTIDYVRKIAASAKVGNPSAFNREWSFYKGDGETSSTDKASANGSINAKVTVSQKSGDVYPSAGYSTYFAAGTLKSLDHISLTYKTTAPLAVKLAMQNDKVWEVWLNNVGAEVQSGKIPLSAFHYNQYDIGTKRAPNPADIVGIEIQLLTSGDKEEEHTLAISDVTTYAGGVSIAAQKSSVTKQNVSVASLTNSVLNLNLATKGTYHVAVHSIDGRMIQSFKNKTLSSGLNRLSLNGIASGIYMITIKNDGFEQSLKAMAL